ncbi:hypothetical protein M0R04_15335 [Candidatus Dojkabacteria bacterium]|jgi:hypothetical protein|nr:hypothetical protein [Candidatus Dojkabacteria bacterium]
MGEKNVTPESMVVNGTKYVPETLAQKAAQVDGLDYVIVRSIGAGVFAGWLESKIGTEAVLRNARRFWKWSGARELCELARDGVKNPGDCRFSVVVTKVLVEGVCEIQYPTEKAKKTIDSVKEWVV